MSLLFEQVYNPDILNCLANLSNDEVFTPPEVVNNMLDMLPQELFTSPDTTFLDPACKTGVFLREIAKRLMEGLKDIISDENERRKHIFTKQLFGIAITEMTSMLSRRSLYCSKYANTIYSIVPFEGVEGNIRFKNTEHYWEGNRCGFCGASKSQYDRDKDLEQHAYEFIHTSKPEEIWNMKFDVIIGNPPYQLDDGGYGISAQPIYDKFISSAIQLNPRYLTMVVPARWYAGGKGLDDFRSKMLNDNRLRVISDYPQAFDCFPGVQIKGGVCFFLWDRDNRGDCAVTTNFGNTRGRTVVRPLLEEGLDTFIRYNEAVGVVRKVKAFKENTMEELVSPRQPFGLPTNFHGKTKGAIKLYENRGVSYVDVQDIVRNGDVVDKYKVFIPRAGSGSDAFPHPILGTPFIGEPNSASSETYIFIGPFASKRECENVITYIKTRFFRFLAMLKKVTQSTTRTVYTLVPIQDFSKPWTDAELYEKYGLSEEEVAFVERMIRPMD